MSLSLALTLALLQVGPGPALDSGADDFIVDLEKRPERENTLTAPSDPISIWLDDCLTLLEEDAARAHTQAQIRRNETSGTARIIANHCLGLAATQLELWDDAVTAFVAARDETPSSEGRTRSRFDTMAGNAALASGDLDQALMLLSRAQSTARTAQEGTLEGLSSIDIARVLVGLNRPGDALGQLDNALRLLPQLSEPWLLKATLLRRMDRLDDAQQAIETAADLAPMEPQIGIEAGVIAVLGGRDEAARQSWQSVIDRLPGTPEADAAQAYLAQLDAISQPQ